ncbi:DUF4253 domain-containing protein [Kitasatospora camelliae]|uniref:DUF4253 domain-containing protein n=1 Tax=Kitasatospora camelliae TaxID=3156397 RepID=A0AAU8K7E0_9ACTN
MRRPWRRASRPSPLDPLRADPTGRALGLDLPPGRLCHATLHGRSAVPLMWCSDTPAEPGQWARLAAATRGTGRYPLLLGGGTGYERGPREEVPWRGRLAPRFVTDPDAFDADRVLAEAWPRYVPDDGEDELDDRGRPLTLAPFGPRWPGPAAPCALAGTDPEATAADLADALLAAGTLIHPRLGLAPAPRGADVLTAVGWTGQVNLHTDPAPYTAVLRRWEDRYGARLIALTDDTLHLSVAAPPRTPEHALALAAEHFAFCPDGILQGSGTLAAYAAEAVLDQPSWCFWWD